MNTRIALLTALLASGCAADLPEQWEIRDVRLLGAKVEVAGDPTRPRPKLEEAFSIRQYVAVPEPVQAPRYDVAAIMCLAFRAPGGDLTCVGEQALPLTVQTLGDGEVTFGPMQLDLAAVNAGIGELTPNIPAGVSLGADEIRLLATQFGVDRIAVFGALCAEGRAEQIPGTSARKDDPGKLFRCVGDGGEALEGNAFTLSVLLDLGRAFDANHNPSFACDASAPSPCVDGVALPGEARVPGPIVLALPTADETAPREVVAWPEPNPGAPLPWDDCAADPSVVKVAAGSGDHQIRLRFDPSDRENYQYEIRDNGVFALQSERESVVVANALTFRGGELSRYYSTINGSVADAEAETSLRYTPPLGEKDSDDDGIVPTSGRLVRFYFLLRDQRGGVDTTTRVLCLVPGSGGE